MSDSTQEREMVGFIGIGFMGHGMAKNILEKGYPLTFLGRANRAPAEDLKARGALEVSKVSEVAARSSVIFLCVTGSREVENIVNGPDGLKPSLKTGSIIVDCSTSDPNSTLALASELDRLGVHYADAPLGGTPKDAEAGTLQTMVGASDAVFERLKPVLETWAARAVHIGALGDGHRMKLLSNFLSLGYGALYAEALVLAKKVGITPHRFDSVIRGGRMDCGFYQTFMKYTLENDRDAHKFSIANAFKDLCYLESMADAVGLVNPLGNAVKNSFAVAAAAAGGAQDYVPMLVDHIARANNVRLKPGAE
jgi:3-hydroxyisobutyrate dehydrogenase-like beta-hydroxyacid dehydrogenase